jgi:hypothetical protein
LPAGPSFVDVGRQLRADQALSVRLTGHSDLSFESENPHFSDEKCDAGSDAKLKEDVLASRVLWMSLGHPLAGFWVFVSSTTANGGRASCVDDMKRSNVGLFIPRFSDTLSSTAGAGLLSAFNVSCIIAQILWGFLTDVNRAYDRLSKDSDAG